MRFIQIFLLVVFIGVSFYSCDRCSKIGCLSSNYYGQFRIIRVNDSTDMVFGKDKVYDKTKIKFYSLQGADTIFLDYQPYKASYNTFDSVLQVYFYPPVDTAYMRLSDGDIDTLNLTYTTYGSDPCCPSETEITTIRFNNITDFFDSRAVQVITK